MTFELQQMRLRNVLGIRALSLQFKAGVNLILGPNESGKSTIILALRAVLLERAKSRPVAESLQSQFDQAPAEVALNFSWRGQSYRLEKRFSERNSNTSLAIEGVLLKGDAAEDALAELFVFERSKHGLLNESAMGLLGLLWARQTDLSAPLANAGAQQVLRSGLNKLRQNSVFDSKRLATRLDALVLEYVGKSGRAVGEYAKRLEQQTEQRNALQQTAFALQKLEADQLQLMQKIAFEAEQRQRFNALKTNATQLQLEYDESRAALERRRANFEAQHLLQREYVALAKSMQLKMDASTRQIELYQRALRQQLTTEQTLATLRSEFAEQQVQCNDCVAEHQATQKIADDTALRYRSAREQREQRAFLHQRNQLATWLIQCANCEQQLALLSPRSEMLRRFAPAREILQAKLSTLLQQLQRTQKQVLRVLFERAVAYADAVPLPPDSSPHSAAGAGHDLPVTAHIAAPPSVDGIELEHGVSVHIGAPATFRFGDGSALRIDLPEARLEQDYAELSRYGLELARCSDYTDQPELRALIAGERSALVLDKAKACLQLWSSEAGALNEQQAQLRRQLEMLKANINQQNPEVVIAARQAVALAGEELPAPTDLEPPSVEQLSVEQLVALESEHAAAQSKLSEVRTAQHAMSARMQLVQRRLDQAQVSVEMSVVESVRLLNSSEGAARATPEPKQSGCDQPDQPQILQMLNAEISKHQLQHTELLSEQQALRAPQSSDPEFSADQDRLATQARAIEALQANLEIQQGELLEAIAQKAKLQGGVQEQLNSSLQQRKQKLLSSVQSIETQLAVDQRRIHAARALSGRLAAASQSYEQQFAQPLNQALQPYLALCFGISAQVEFDESLRPKYFRRPFGASTRSLQAELEPGAEAAPALDQSFAIEALSVGAQEQIALLTRLAFADVLAADGRPSFLVLDDVLAYTDAQRLSAMADAFALAARQHQIILTSCHSELWEKAAAGNAQFKIAQRLYLQAFALRPQTEIAADAT